MRRYRSQGEGNGKIRLTTLKRILVFFHGYNRQIIIALITVLFSTAFSCGLPLILREIIDTAIPSKEIGIILITALAYLFLLLSQEGLNYYQSIIVGYMGIEITNTIKTKIFKHVLSLPVKFFNQNSSGTLISRIESDTQQLYMLFSSVGLQLLWALLSVIVSFSIMFFNSAKLTLLVLAITPVYVLGVYIFFSKMRPMFRKDRDLYAKIGGFLSEHIPAINLLKNFHQVGWSREKLADLNKDKFQYGFKINSLESTIWFFLMLMPQLAIAAILYKSVAWIRADLITIGTVWMFIQYIINIIRPVIAVSEQIGEVQRAFGAADRIFALLDQSSEMAPVPKSLPKFMFERHIEFKNVHFHYEKDKPVLNDLSFTIKKGETVALVGPTGSGKTSIISLLAKFYDPIQGSILIDGQDLRDIDKNQLRSKISMVLQDIFLFPANVLDNLRALRQDIPDQKAYQAASDLGVDRYINRFKQQYMTDLHEEGGNLSFGERQLLSFSRALTFDPEILIMDEATSSVDPFTEIQIQKSMSHLMKGRTTIIIAHRLSTIEEADKILVIEDGCVVEQGEHIELLNNHGSYAQLYYNQQEAI